MQYDLVIFDWDGTLMNSAAKIVNSMQQAARALSLPECSDADIKNIIGLGLPEAILELYPQQPADVRQHIRDQYAHFFVNDHSVKSELFTGTLELLESLKSQGRTLAVATGKSRIGLNRIFDETGLGHYFATSRCADETRSKPHPLMVMEILEELKAPSHTAVVVGDTEYDLEMAASAGVARIGVTYGSHSQDRLEKHGPIGCAQDVPELMQMLKVK